MDRNLISPPNRSIYLYVTRRQAGTSQVADFWSTSIPSPPLHTFTLKYITMAGPPVRERYNAKARGSVAGGGAHKKRKRPFNKPIPLAEDGNAEDGAGHQVEERQKMPMEGEGRGGMSAKKRKRMDSYIVSRCPDRYLGCQCGSRAKRPG